jgi:hypothetical protein
MTTATQRIVVQVTVQEKKATSTKAKRLNMPTSELMRRGAFAYQSRQMEAELAVLADTARQAAERASSAIDDALCFVESSNKRIAEMEAKAVTRCAKDSERFPRLG